MITKREFNEIKKRILAQVHEYGRPHVESDLLTLWLEIAETTERSRE